MSVNHPSCMRLTVGSGVPSLIPRALAPLEPSNAGGRRLPGEVRLPRRSKKRPVLHRHALASYER